MVDPRTPVLIGAGQLSNRVDRGATPLEPVDLIAEALRRAADDSGVGAAALTGADAVHIVSLLSWRYRDPGRLVAQRVGADPRTTTVTGMGGNSPQSLVNLACLAILRGRRRPRAPRWGARRGAPAWRLDRPASSSTGPCRATTCPRRPRSTAEVPMSSPGRAGPWASSCRCRCTRCSSRRTASSIGRGLDEHLVAVSELWSRFSEVAATNPHAWIQEAYTPEEIRTPTADNRMIGFPYTKRMNSNNAVEQGAAVILCSAERAEALGVPRDRWVFPHSGTDAHDHYHVTERDDLGVVARHAARGSRRARRWPASASTTSPTSTSTPASRRRCRSRPPSSGWAPTARSPSPAGCPSPAVPGTTTSCTRSPRWPADSARTPAPSASSPPTAASSPSTPSACTAPSRPRPASATPSRRPRSTRSPAACSTRHPTARWPIETWTAMHDRDGNPETGIVVGLLDDGRRALGTTTDADALKVLVTEDLAGRRARIAPRRRDRARLGTAGATGRCSPGRGPRAGRRCTSGRPASRRAAS